MTVVVNVTLVVTIVSGVQAAFSMGAGAGDDCQPAGAFDGTTMMVTVDVSVACSDTEYAAAELGAADTDQA